MLPLRPLLALLIGLLGWSSCPAGQAVDAVSSGSSTAKAGVLANGLRYVVVPHPSPKGDIGLRLVVRAGSLDEHDDERGFAHFVEHMAFNGSQRHPPGTLRQFFQKLGLNFGADLNASTSYTHTSYLLDLPEGQSAKLEESLGVLRDYADGLLFLPEQVQRESGVVRSELNARDGATRRLAIERIKAIYGDTKLPDRDVGGVQEQLARATPDQLRAFYRRNYSPGRMTVVVAGPVDPEAVTRQIALAFEAMTADPSSGEPAILTRPPRPPGVKTAVVPLPSGKGVTINLLSDGPRPPDTVEGRARELAQRLATTALQTRMRERREKGDITLFAPPKITYEPLPFGPWVQHSVELPCSASSWPDGIQLLESELRRSRTNGFSAAEIAEAAAGQLTSARNRAADYGSQPAARIAADVARQISVGRVWRSPAEELAETTQTLQTLTAKEVTAELDHIFPADALHLMLIAPPEEAIKPERVLAAYTKSAGRSVKNKSENEEALRFRYENFGSPGTVAKTQRIDDLNLTLLTFANGAQLNLRPTSFEPGRFRLRVVFPQNFSDVPNDRGGLSELAVRLFSSSNLGKHTQSEIARLLKTHGVSADMSITNGTPSYTMSGPSAELSFGLRLLTALLSDLELDTDHYRTALSFYGGEHQRLTKTPAALALRTALRAHTGGDRRIGFNSPQAFASQSGNDEADDWLRAYILNGPLEIGLVGDFDPVEAEKIAAASVGTLKRRRAARPGSPLSSPAKAIRQEGSADLPASTSLSCVLWPVPLPDDPKSNAALALATDVLRDREMVVLRESLGATYSPDVRIFRDAVQRDFAFVGLINTFDPALSQRLSLVSLAVGARLAEKGVSPEEFNRLREPLRARRTQDMRSNAWWIGGVAVAQRRPEVTEEMRRHENVFDGLTLEDVNAAAQVFKPDRHTSVLLHPASAKIPGPGKGAKSAPAGKN